MWAVIEAGSTVVRRHEGTPSLEEMQEAVGGLVETVDLHRYDDGRTVTLWVNEEGLILRLTPTVHLPNGTPLVGPVVVTACETSTGETVPLHEEELGRVTLGQPFIVVAGHGLVPAIRFTAESEEVPRE